MNDLRQSIEDYFTNCGVEITEDDDSGMRVSEAEIDRIYDAVSDLGVEPWQTIGAIDDDTFQDIIQNH